MSESEGFLLCGVVYAAEGSDSAVLVEVAREFSPRIEICGPREITLDLSGLSRLFGEARTIAEELRRTAADRGLRVRVAIAGTRTAARLLVRHRAGLTVIEPGTEAAALSPLPLALVEQVTTTHQPSTTNPKAATHHPPTDVFRRWGLRTLGELVALPPDEVMARLGLPGIEWQRLARGEDARPLVPAVPEERFEQSVELEWPVEGLEPLSFILGRLMEPLSAHLEQRDRSAAVLHVRLRLVTRQPDAGGTDVGGAFRRPGAKEVHVRTLDLPAPMREARTLRTLALLDLESHPPAAAIEAVTVAVDPTPARIVQYSLLTRPLPTPEQLSTLMARLHALMGESRCGSPSPVDSWAPGAFAMKPFAPSEGTPQKGTTATSPRDFALHEPQRHREHREHRDSSSRKDDGAVPVTALRRFRRPVPARVQVEDGKPVRIVIDRRGLSGGAVANSAGPWRTSGSWWTSEASGSASAIERSLCEVTRKSEDARKGKDARMSGIPWDKDEWDVLLEDGATYRLFRERGGKGHWFVDGVVD
jgi:nucleotidyltransferase/DNA polymerase involved in DNA repair